MASFWHLLALPYVVLTWVHGAIGLCGNRTFPLLMICLLTLTLARVCCAEPFGYKGGPDIENIGEINELLRQHPYDLVPRNN